MTNILKDGMSFEDTVHKLLKLNGPIVLSCLSLGNHPNLKGLQDGDRYGIQRVFKATPPEIVNVVLKILNHVVPRNESYLNDPPINFYHTKQIGRERNRLILESF
jgi:hypothetical protein